MKSMTGFGKAEKETKQFKFNVEIRSLNSKQLDLNLRLPSLLRSKEMELRQMLSSILVRGKADVYVGLEKLEIKPIEINESLLMSYYATFKQIQGKINETETSLLPLLLKQSDIYRSEKQELNEEQYEQFLATLKLAVEQFNAFRTQEGQALNKDLEARIHLIAQYRSSIIALDKQRIDAVKQRLTNKINELKDIKIDQNRLEQELVYFIEKLDVTEELVRLENHLQYFIKTMQEADAGRKLGFISQEIGREINTIGSKCNDADIQKIVVNMKDELEKIKEQSLNIL
jgi:uncharacterized protein (TIGR00255 family)